MKTALILFLPLAIFACSAAQDPQAESTDDTSEALGKSPAPTAPTSTGTGPSLPGSHYGPVPPDPFSKTANYCPAVDPNCSIGPMGIPDPELTALGCLQSLRWWSGYGAGWLGSPITLCTDTPALRRHFPAYKFDVMNGACDLCIPKAPAGQVWVALEMWEGPNCQSGCKARNEGGW